MNTKEIRQGKIGPSEACRETLMSSMGNNAISGEERALGGPCGLNGFNENISDLIWFP